MNNQKFESKKMNINADKVGIACSSLCAVHCLIMPIIILLLPGLGSMFHNHYIHGVLLLLVVPVALMAFFRNKNGKLPLILGVLGICFLLLGFGAEYVTGGHHFENHLFETVTSIIGSLLLVSGHVINLKLSK